MGQETIEINEKYVVYELNNLMGNEKYKALEEVSFNGFVSNRFDSEKEAIEALVKDDKLWMDFVILKQVYITRH